MADGKSAGSGDDMADMTSIEARLLASAMASLKADVSEIRLSMTAMQRALESLVRLDEQQGTQRQALGRAFDEIKESRGAVMTLTERVHLLEVDSPSYKELRRWVIGGVLTGIIALLSALFAIVFKVVIADPVERRFTPNYQQPPALIRPRSILT